MKGYGKAARQIQSRGDHEVWTSPHARKPFTESRHTANKVLKDAGLPKAF